MKKKKQNREISEQELLDTIDIISTKLSYKFKFGYHELEDMKQQISIFALEGLQNYDYQRPLENFLWTHVRNRYIITKETIIRDQINPATLAPFLIKRVLTKITIAQSLLTR